MPRPYITMRTVRDVLRLRFAEGLSLRQIASLLTIPHTTVAIYVERASKAGLSWPLPDEMKDDDLLREKLFGSPSEVRQLHEKPDFSIVHQELRKKV